MPTEEGKGQPLPLHTTPHSGLQGANLSKDDTKENDEHASGSNLKLASYEWIIIVDIFLVATAVRVYMLERTGSQGVRYNADTFSLPKLLAMLTDLVPGYHADDAAPTPRLLTTTLGALTAPLAYLTTRLLECHPSIALLAALFITFDCGLITQSRYILPDTTLFFFTSFSFFLWFAFTQINKRQPFSRRWWRCLTMTGFSVGAVISCKWSGMLTAATVAVGILYQVWAVKDASDRMRHLKARVLCLMVLPAVFYLITQQVYNVAAGMGDVGLSAEEDSSAPIFIGSTVTIRPYNHRGYLHSNNLSYTSGSKQQRIMLHSSDDHNTKWIIKESNSNAVGDHYLTRVLHDSHIRLRHAATWKYLHSHQEHTVKSSPMTAFEVTGYGVRWFAGDGNDNWVIEIVDGGMQRDGEFFVRTQGTIVAFRHVSTGCYLYSNGDKLPNAKWRLGQQQLEVTCNRPDGPLHLLGRNALWYFESSEIPGSLDVPEARTAFASSNMKTSESWFFLLNRGVDFRIAPRKPLLFKLNPVVWWLSILGVASYAISILSLISRARNGRASPISSRTQKYLTTGGFLFPAWGIHYVPYYFVNRKLFIYDYFPGLYISLLLLFVTLDVGIESAGLRKYERAIVVLIMLVVLLVGYGNLVRDIYEMPTIA